MTLGQCIDSIKSKDAKSWAGSLTRTFFLIFFLYL